MNSSRKGIPEESVIETKSQWSASHVHHEDVAMKVAAQYFGEELLPYFGVTERVKYVWPTETIHLEARQMYQDFNYLMEDGSLGHFEFESDEITVDDLRRFRDYEASTSRTYQIPVVTYVVCSDKAKVLRSELNEGINTYRVHLVRLKSQNADEFFAQLEQQEKLQRKDYVGMILTPLMSGKMSHKDRILRSIYYLRDQVGALSADEVSKIQAMLYTLACKFLNRDDLKSVKEVLRMTILGEMIYNDGVADGIEQGIEQGIERGIEQGIERGIEQGMEKGIQALIRACMNLGASKENILSSLMQEFSLDEEKAGEYVEKYGKK